MRARLIVSLTVPLVLLLAGLGVGYGMRMAESSIQGLYLDRLNDTAHFLPGARQSLASNDLSVIGAQLDRYGEVYGIGAAVLGRNGEVLVSNGLQPRDLSARDAQRVETALAGRSSGLPDDVLPWHWGDLVVAEPVIDAGDLVGAVVTSSSTAALADATMMRWWRLVLGGLTSIAVSAVLVLWLARWVLRPVRMMASAMSEMRHGHMGTRISDSSGPPELRRVLAEFNTMAAEVEELIGRQRAFVSNAAHELRNPLNAMLLRIEHLGMGLDDSWETDIDDTRDEGIRMARILDSLERLAEHERAQIDLHPVELRTLVTERVRSWAPVADERGIRLVVVAGDAMAIDGDDVMLEQALDTVLDNAVKFSPAGGTIRIRLVREAEGTVIEVADEGSGIPAGEISRATERFWRSPVHNAIPGSGLGLAIATESLEALSGELTLRNEPEGGLVVALRLPHDGGAR